MTTEAEAKLEIAQASRILFGEAILDAFGHVSRRHPDRPDRFLISRSLAPGQVTPTDVLEVDFDGKAVSDAAPRLFLERFIHAEIYRQRRDVDAVVHSHAMGVLPFAAVPTARVQPICHMCGFLRDTPSPFDVADHAGPGSDLLIRNSELGAALAKHLGAAAVTLMRGHGYTAVGASIAEATYRAIYTARNCEAQQSAHVLGMPVYLTAAEAEATEASVISQITRPWDLWCEQYPVPADQAA
ncbi:3-hydroxy-2-methylpyridine-4,5-dicarboxylate 4-decarboxylase (plasmid) [Sphingobium sp. AntQ-1]|uniref:class II aldolase/adducin family protein n=1 Tax=Sphingobium sp. AntQ-1 TaxID=2930091 RepID=UPI00234F85FE|nr:class II aldolase/adducin family protein [Sphingobium sp. AntQ-1]WCP16282.1 3-hydroxy-2-methylpyridine-4,5-dicarboxylate 4-decarboxylase [Sphingobium sp. AntQ-1]